MTTDSDPKDRRQVRMTMESFFIRELQNHYPSAGRPRECSAVIQVDGFSMDVTDNSLLNADEVPFEKLKITTTPMTAWINFENFPLIQKQDAAGIIRLIEEVPAPYIRKSDGILAIFLAASLLPTWQMILTTLTKKYYITLKNNSHAFLGVYPDNAIKAHKVGGNHPSA